MTEEAQKIVGRAQKSHLVDALVRIGYFTRGVVYGLIGFLAARTAFLGHGQITDQKGALAAIAAQPYGRVLLIVVAVGLLGLALWGLIRAIADPFHKGKDAKGIIARVGYLVSGVSYGSLLAPALLLIRGARQAASSSGQAAQNAAAGIMSRAWGPWLVGLVGIGLAIVGAVRIRAGLQARFNERFKSYQMSAQQNRWIVRLGRSGYVAVGLVFVIIGLLALTAALELNPNEVTGLDGALLFLARQPYGPWLLGAVALGLIAYAIYSMMGALWFRIKEL